MALSMMIRLTIELGRLLRGLSLLEKKRAKVS